MKFRIFQTCGTFRLPGITIQKNKQKKLLDERVVCYTGQIFTVIRFRPNLYNIPVPSVSSLASNIQEDQDTSGNSSWVPLHYIGHVQVSRVLWVDASLTCERTSLPTFWSLPKRVCKLKFALWRPLNTGEISTSTRTRKKPGTYFFFFVLMLMIISLVLCLSHKCEAGVSCSRSAVYKMHL